MFKRQLFFLKAPISSAGAKLLILASILTIGLALMPMQVRSQQPQFETGIISSYNTTGFVKSAYPVINRLKNGRLICVYSGITDPKSMKMNIAFSTSEDNGLTWSNAEILFNHPNSDEYDPNLILDGDRILAFSTTVNRPVNIDSTDIYMRSSQDGRTWANEVHVKKPYHYISGKIHQGHRLKDGTLIMGYCWDAWAEKGMPPKTEGEMDNRSGVLRSNDGGITWSAGTDIYAGEVKKKTEPGAAEGLAEPATVVLADGRIMAILRSGSDELYKTWSSDGGLSWETPRLSGLTAHNSPAALWKLDNSSDVIVAWCNSPIGRNPLAVALSTDGGKTWSPPKTVANTGGSGGRKGGQQASYPSVVQAKDGTFIVLWQQDTDQGREVRFARFNRTWLLNRDKQ